MTLRALIPREHGAYVQLALPLGTALTVGGATVPGGLLVLTFVAGFLAHEPLLVLLGRRGPRARREGRVYASAWLIATVVAAAIAASAAALRFPAHERWTLLVPALPAVIVGAAVAAHREKHVAAELAVALTFALGAVPVTAAGQHPWPAGAAVASTFAAVFVSAVLAVRGILQGSRAGRTPRDARPIRVATIVVAGVLLAAFVVAARVGALPIVVAVAAAPGLVSAAWLAIDPPPGRRLREVGLLVSATSSIAAVVLAVCL